MNPALYYAIVNENKNSSVKYLVRKCLEIVEKCSLRRKVIQ